MQSEYNLDYISFKGRGYSGDIKTGIYSIILKVCNGDFIDYIDLSTVKSIDNVIEVDNVSYRIFKSNLKNRLMLEVK